MTDVGLALLAIAWLIVVAGVADWLLRWFGPASAAHPRIALARRLVPSWRLFGQGGGSYDLRWAVVDWLDTDGASDQHDDARRRRVWWHALIDPGRRVQGLRRRLARYVLAFASTARAAEIADLPDAQVAARLGAWTVVDHHPSDAADRSFSVVVIVDRGFFSSVPQRAELELGPYRVKDVLDDAADPR